MIELKPCPFCGQVARLFVHNNGVKVMCTECNCQTDTYNDYNKFTGTDLWRCGSGNAVEIVIKEWNRRVEA